MAVSSGYNVGMDTVEDSEKRRMENPRLEELDVEKR